jgi:hypothetical protein
MQGNRNSPGGIRAGKYLVSKSQLTDAQSSEIAARNMKKLVYERDMARATLLKTIPVMARLIALNNMLTDLCQSLIDGTEINYTHFAEEDFLSTSEAVGNASKMIEKALRNKV